MLQPKIIFISRDKIGERMAGTAQRYTELAAAASKYVTVGLLAPPGSTRPAGLCKEVEFLSKDASLLRVSKFISQYDIWFSQTISKKELFVLKRNKAKFIYDGYDPVYIENLERLSYESDDRASSKHLEFIRTELRRALLEADKIAFATPQQKHYLLGQLQSIKGVNLSDYRKNHVTADKFIAVPFGLNIPPTMTKKQRDVLRSTRGVGPGDQLLLWGGGMWNWFDPITLLESLRKDFVPKNTKVFFPGFKHPDPQFPQMKIANEVINYIEKYPKVKSRLIIDSEWVPYDRRSELFGITDVGLSLHYDSLETELAFRTRVLEYLAHEVPILTTEGDYFATEVERNQLGKVVPYRDSLALGDALRQLNSENSKIYKKNIHLYRVELTWDKIVQTLLATI